MNCPGSVALVQKMPPQPSNKYADEGTLLHNVIAEIVMSDKHPEEFLGTEDPVASLIHFEDSCTGWANVCLDRTQCG